ncbi:hypothetical protein EVA_10759 [gut metagenome]|uniref:Uncharacterized protein n=1 Tax=gut metagenome TaxID=749906 RepID=J9G1Q8_9ZZZZ
MLEEKEWDQFGLLPAKVVVNNKHGYACSPDEGGIRSTISYMFWITFKQM